MGRSVPRDKTLKVQMALAISLLSFLLLPGLFPEMRLSYFAPFAIVLIYRKTLAEALFITTLVGGFQDLFSPYPFGMMALCTALPTLFLYPRKKHFFADHLATMPLMTFFFVVIKEGMLAAILHVPYSFAWIFTDLIVMSLFDALYAFIFFTLPFLLLERGEINYLLQNSD